MLFTLTTVVRWMTTLFTTRGPPQPPHHGLPMKPARPHQGTTGSPQPSATQLTTGALTVPRIPGAPKNPTRAGAYAGRTTTGPGAHAQKPIDHPGYYRLAASGRHGGLPGPPGDEGRPLLRHVCAVEPRVIDREGGVGCVQFHGATRIQATQIERDVPVRDPELQEIGLLVREPKLRVAPGPHEGPRAHLHLEVALGARVELVAGRQGGVGLGG